MLLVCFPLGVSCLAKGELEWTESSTFEITIAAFYVCFKTKVLENTITFFIFEGPLVFVILSSLLNKLMLTPFFLLLLKYC